MTVTDHVVSVDFLVEATCPCGSEIVHLISLEGHADCPRCNHRFGVVAIEYRRASAGLPAAKITIGYVA